jgi:hypothetical protein
MGIVDAQTGLVTEWEPKDCEECYTLIFNTNKPGYGKSALNTIAIINILNPIEIITTKIGEMIDDANKYCSAIILVKSYIFEKDVLKLYYNNGENYLQYKLIDLWNYKQLKNKYYEK